MINFLFGFIVGVLIGTVVGIGLMCILQIAKGDDSNEK